MSMKIRETTKTSNATNIITFYHDIEQDIDSKANPEECRQMVKEFLKLEKKYSVPATYNVVGKIFEGQPDLIEWIKQEGQEVAYHSYNHQSDWQPRYFADEIRLCRKVSPIPVGYRSPSSQWDKTTLSTLWENGFLWNAEGDTHKEPYFIHKGLVRLPIAFDDWPLHTNTMNVNAWVQHFVESFTKRNYIALGLHDSVASFAPEERLQAWERVLKIAAENGSLLLTFSEAADLYRRAAVSKYYSSTAKSWNKGTKTLYRTKRFIEMLRSETEKLEQPVIADLGSAGGVLTSNLKDIAAKIYCVDNSPGMVADVDLGSKVQAWIGDATESGLPDDSIDFVICTRIIEYLSWPDHLADEIKRVGKMGAKFFVTFPALRSTPPFNEGYPPDKIRRHFNKDEIYKWASQIGEGRLIGIQYNEEEPFNPEMERQYRSIENIQPSDMYPTNWVYIGTIQNKTVTKQRKIIIQLKDFTFQFPNDKYDYYKMFKKVGRLFPPAIRKLGKRVLGR